MVAPIVIDLGVTDPPREAVQVLLESCTQAAANTQCHLVREAPEGPYAAVAIVTWEGNDKVRVEVGLRRPDGAVWRSRDIGFQVADAQLERYKSVGFVVGTLASSEGSDTIVEPAEPADLDPEPEPPPPPITRAPSRPLERDELPHARALPRGWVSIAATGGRAVDRGGPRFGGNLRVGVRVVSPLSVLVSASASARGRDERGLSLSWMDAGFGLGFTLGNPTSLRLDLRAEAVLEHLTAEARTNAGVDTNTNTRGAARAGLDGILPLTDIVALVGSVETLFRSTTTAFLVESEPNGETTRVEIGGALGARLDL
jgi:hypothetical protein